MIFGVKVLFFSNKFIKPKLSIETWSVELLIDVHKSEILLNSMYIIWVVYK